MKRLLALTLLLVSCGTAGAEVGTVGPVPTTTPATTTTTTPAEPVAAPVTVPQEPSALLLPAAPDEPVEPPPVTTTTAPPLVLPDLPECPEVTYTGDVAPPLPEGFPGDCASRVPTPAELGY